MINVGFIGAGEIAGTHAAALQRVSGARLVAVTDVNRARAEQLAAHHGAEVCADLESLLRFAGLDVVYILTPPIAHEQQIMAAAEAGLPIMCEKPLTVTLAQADRAIAHAHKYNVPLMTGFTHRFHPLAQKLRAYVLDGVLGSFIAAWSHRLIHLPIQPESWLNDLSAAGGLTLQYAIHDLDWALSLGGAVEQVTAQQYRANTELAIEDNLWALLRFKNEGSGSIGASWSAAHPRTERGVVGTRGAVRISEQRRLTGRLHDGTVLEEDLGDDYDWFDVFVRQSEDVISCVQAGTPFTVTGEDGRRALEVSLAVLRAAQEKRSLALPLTRDSTTEVLT